MLFNVSENILKGSQIWLNYVIYKISELYYQTLKFYKIQKYQFNLLN